MRLLFVTTQQGRKHHKECGWKSANLSRKTQYQFAWHVLSLWEVSVLPGVLSAHSMFDCFMCLWPLYFHISLPMRWVVDCAGNEQFHDVTCTDCTIGMMPSTHDQSNGVCRFHVHIFFNHIVCTLFALTCHIRTIAKFSHHVILSNVKPCQFVSPAILWLSRIIW